MHEMGSCVTKVDARPGMSENYANYYGVKMHHSEHRFLSKKRQKRERIKYRIMFKRERNVSSLRVDSRAAHKRDHDEISRSSSFSESTTKGVQLFATEHRWPELIT